MRKIFGVRTLAFMASLLAVSVMSTGVAQERSSTAGSSPERTSGSQSGQSRRDKPGANLANRMPAASPR